MAVYGSGRTMRRNTPSCYMDSLLSEQSGAVSSALARGVSASSPTHTGRSGVEGRPYKSIVITDAAWAPTTLKTHNQAHMEFLFGVIFATLTAK